MFFGYFGDRISRKIGVKRLFILINCFWIFGYGLLSLSPNYAFFLSAIIISAIGTGAFIPIGFSMVGEFFHAKDRGKKFGLLQFGLILGNGLGIIIGLLLANIFNQIGWRIAYLSVVLLNLIILSTYILIAIQPERGRTDPEFADFLGLINYNYKITKGHLLQLVKTKSVIGILLSVLCGGIATSTLANWGIYYLTLKFGSTTLASIVYLIVGTAALPGAIIGGKISDHFFNSNKKNNRFVISIMAILIGSINLLLFYQIPINYWIVLLLTGIFGYFFSSFNIGTQFAIYSEVCVPEVRSTVNALNGLMINIGGICGNLLLSIILYQNISFLSNAILLVLIIWLLGSFFWILPWLNYTKDFLRRNRVMIKKRLELEQKKVYFTSEK
jgi:predicted MFS family arabinose efflux permease